MKLKDITNVFGSKKNDQLRIRSRKDKNLKRKLTSSMNKKLNRMSGIICDPSKTIGLETELKLSPAITVHYTSKIVDVAKVMSVNDNTTCVLVIDDRGQLCGILTDKDIVFRVLATGMDPRRTLVHTVMTANPVTATLETAKKVAMQAIYTGAFWHIPIISENDASSVVKTNVIGMINLNELFGRDIIEKLKQTPSFLELSSIPSASDNSFIRTSVYSDIDMISRYEEIRQQNLTVVLDQHDESPPEIDGKMNVSIASNIMKIYKKGAVIVCDSDSRSLLGILTTQDLILRVVAAGRYPGSTSVKSVMTPNPPVVNPNKQVSKTLQYMLDNNYKYIVIGADLKITGIVDILEVTRAALQQLQDRDEIEEDARSRKSFSEDGSFYETRLMHRSSRSTLQSFEDSDKTKNGQYLNLIKNSPTSSSTGNENEIENENENDEESESDEIRPAFLPRDISLMNNLNTMNMNMNNINNMNNIIPETIPELDEEMNDKEPMVESSNSSNEIISRGIELDSSSEPMVETMNHLNEKDIPVNLPIIKIKLDDDHGDHDSPTMTTNTNENTDATMDESNLENEIIDPNDMEPKIKEIVLPNEIENNINEIIEQNGLETSINKSLPLNEQPEESNAIKPEIIIETNHEEQEKTVFENNTNTNTNTNTNDEHPNIIIENEPKPDGNNTIIDSKENEIENENNNLLNIPQQLEMLEASVNNYHHQASTLSNSQQDSERQIPTIDAVLAVEVSDEGIDNINSNRTFQDMDNFIVSNGNDGIEVSDLQDNSNYLMNDINDMNDESKVSEEAKRLVNSIIESNSFIIENEPIAEVNITKNEIEIEAETDNKESVDINAQAQAQAQESNNNEIGSIELNEINVQNEDEEFTKDREVKVEAASDNNDDGDINVCDLSGIMPSSPPMPVENFNYQEAVIPHLDLNNSFENNESFSFSIKSPEINTSMINPDSINISMSMPSIPGNSNDETGNLPRNDISFRSTDINSTTPTIAQEVEEDMSTTLKPILEQEEDKNQDDAKSAIMETIPLTSDSSIVLDHNQEESTIERGNLIEFDKNDQQNSTKAPPKSVLEYIRNIITPNVISHIFKYSIDKSQLDDSVTLNNTENSTTMLVKRVVGGRDLYDEEDRRYNEKDDSSSTVLYPSQYLNTSQKRISLSRLAATQSIIKEEDLLLKCFDQETEQVYRINYSNETKYEDVVETIIKKSGIENRDTLLFGYLDEDRDFIKIETEEDFLQGIWLARKLLWGRLFIVVKRKNKSLKSILPWGSHAAASNANNEQTSWLNNAMLIGVGIAATLAVKKISS